jgi:hypothetical protein
LRIFRESWSSQSLEMNNHLLVPVNSTQRIVFLPPLFAVYMS